MKPSYQKLLILILCGIIIVSTSLSQSDFSINRSPLPPPTSPVMDYVGILSEESKRQLEKKIIDFENQTNPRVQMAVVIVASTGGRDIFEYSLAVARGWGIGSKEDDNPGLLLLIAFNDKKYFTQISRDLEDELPDSLVGQIQRQHLVPAFRQGNYAKGINDTIDAYMQVIKSKQSAEPLPTNSAKRKVTQSNPTSFLLCCSFAVLIFLLFMLFASRSSKKTAYGSRGKGMSDRGGGFFIFPPFDGGSSGDSGWSSGSDWGGFGGGGDFGGGGAGGDW